MVTVRVILVAVIVVVAAEVGVVVVKPSLGVEVAQVDAEVVGDRAPPQLRAGLHVEQVNGVPAGAKRQLEHAGHRRVAETVLGEALEVAGLDAVLQCQDRQHDLMLDVGILAPPVAASAEVVPATALVQVLGVDPAILGDLLPRHPLLRAVVRERHVGAARQLAQEEDGRDLLRVEIPVVVDIEDLADVEAGDAGDVVEEDDLAQFGVVLDHQVVLAAGHRVVAQASGRPPEPGVVEKACRLAASPAGGGLGAAGNRHQGEEPHRRERADSGNPTVHHRDHLQRWAGTNSRGALRRPGAGSASPYPSFLMTLGRSSAFRWRGDGVYFPGSCRPQAVP